MDINPFVSKANLKTFINQQYIDNILKCSIIDLITKFKVLYILTLNNNLDDYNNYELIKSNIIIKPIPFNILKNDYIKEFLTIINKKHLINIDQEEILVISLINISSNSIDSYIKQYNGIASFKDIINIFLINNFLQIKDTLNISNNNLFIKYQLINNIYESNYWCILNNCKLNITLQFMSRLFNLNLTQKLENNNIKNVFINKSEDNDYLNFLFKKQTYVDAAIAINNNGYNIYTINKINPDNIINKIEFNYILDNVSTHKELYLILTNILLSKDYCHLVVNNIHALNKLLDSNLFNKNILLNNKRSLLEKYTPIFALLWSYAWLTLYIEESIKKSHITETDRFVFTLDTASKLPYFPCFNENISSSPYLPIMINTNVLSAYNNNLGIKMYCLLEKHTNTGSTRFTSREEGNDGVPGIINQIEFQNRINIFISGDIMKNYLKDIDWNNIAITGSIMACCLPKFNPLMLNNNIIDFNYFCNKYYKTADIDVMCNLDYIDYITKIYEFNNLLIENIKYYNKNETEDNITKIDSIKTATIIVNKEFIINNILPNTDYILSDIILNLHKIEIKKIFYSFYTKYKMNINQQYINTKYYTDLKYQLYFKLIDVKDLIIVLGNKKQEDTYNEDDNIKSNTNNEYIFFCNENLKFYISSKYLKHNFEFFKIKYETFFSTVARFHLPIVRSYFTNNLVFMLPSCISACMTFMNMDYKYFAGTKDPIEIINKYRTRGFGTFLNNKEKIKMIKYSIIVNKWKNLYDIKTNIELSDNLLLDETTNLASLGICNYTISNFFGSKKYYYNIFNNNENKLVNYDDYIINEITIKDYYSKIFRGNYDNLDNINSIIFMTTCISPLGYIKQFKKWLIEACYDNPIKI